MTPSLYALLIATAQIGPIARDFGIAKMPFAVPGTIIPLLTLTLSIDNLMNGLTCPLCGFISDKFGRENTSSASDLLALYRRVV